MHPFLQSVLFAGKILQVTKTRLTRQCRLVFFTCGAILCAALGARSKLGIRSDDRMPQTGGPLRPEGASGLRPPASLPY